ncbi:MAG: hypothetical protein KJ850_05755 [Gammaproteobacteria bacterium]|nr:hypothetical protein [Gammaproteobacteria bacterium]MBU1624538.1 hypothetical protein [Gammaproteobacteria bacterium]MBU1982382.1 hypothetical protein [Gammaproteobacteria bacterium]
MFGDDIVFRVERELELEIERKCLILQLDSHDAVAAQAFAHDVLNHLDSYGKAAADGDMQARIKIELYGMAVLMHKSNTANFGAGYMTQLDALSARESAWVNIARAIWNELERRSSMDEVRNAQQ